MAEEAWRGILNHLLYTVQFDRVLSDERIDQIAEMMVVRRNLTAGPELYYQAFSQALQAEQLYGPQAVPMAIQHDEATLRDIITRLLPRLDARRPWPEARFVQLPVWDWAWAEAPVVAVLGVGFHDVMGLTWHMFAHVKMGGTLMDVMVLRQRTGEVIALVLSTGPRPEDRRTTSFRVLEGDPAAALSSFVELIGLAEEKVLPASQWKATVAQPVVDDDWRGILNQLLYVLEYYPNPDDADIDAIAENMVQRKILPSGPEVYHRAYTQALQSAQLLDPQSLPTRHDEASLRDVMARLLPRLEARRPWPEPRFEKLPPGAWAFGSVPTTATIRASRGKVAERIWQVFDYVTVGNARPPVAVLRQRSGEVIALVASTGPRPEQRSSVSLRVLQGDPTAAVASFMDLTGFDSDMVVAPDPTSDGDGVFLYVPDELEFHRVFPRRGRLWRVDDATRFDTGQGAVMRSGGPGRAIYVMDSQGNLYVSTVETIGTFHHSSFLGGKPVAGAGELVVHDGKLVEIAGRNPQYPVGEDSLRNVLTALGQQDLDMTNIVVR